MEIFIVIAIAAVAVAAAIMPLVRRGADAAAREPAEPPDLAHEVRAYRAALRAGTLCERCGRANVEGSRYCMECGARLSRRPVHRAAPNDAREPGERTQTGEPADRDHAAPDDSRP